MSDDETYEIPLQDQRIFGAGIKRQRVKFIPSTEASFGSEPVQVTGSKSVSDLYLGLVLPGDLKTSNGISTPTSLSDVHVTPGPACQEENESRVCDVCKLPLSSNPASEADPSPTPRSPSSKPRPHEASLAHQVCLTHSYPPSHLDRNRKGLTYLTSYGWDPDSRLGLGASGQGIQFPIKTKPKDDKMGIGVVLPKEAERRRKEKPTKLDAGKVRKLQEKDRKKAEKLREVFYGNDDIERYLGGG
jgi:hypothetical protein